ncbi:MAG: formate dehydrogenase accessory sulfurtransferase FdhD [Phycisphaerales bacterium]|nr:formate dehydrogenase accessory sulfurtransferase FdhD [Phycisphaerales bacterium]MCC7412975.1 formate dehydrogenase accessory sulfurtransferase FdhD [Gammaproteobacteria bacterium]
MSAARYRPEMTRAGLEPTYPASAVDEFGEAREARIAGELPLTIYVDRREIVTLMTLGTFPEALTLGYLKNQGLIDDIRNVVSVHVDWDVNAAAVRTRDGIGDWEEKLARRTVTTGCGQGTVYGDVMEQLGKVRLPRPRTAQSVIYSLLARLSRENEIYKSAGAVHGCALCLDDQVLTFIEDVGRHNAVDAIAGLMWLDGVDGGDKIFYTTGRLTSEMVIKVAQMGIPVLLSRSGITRMGLELARQVGVTMISRAKGRHFLVFNGADNIVFDAIPDVPAEARARGPLRRSASETP